MVDLALKMILDDKARFAATVVGVGVAVALVLIQVGLFLGLLENASITIEKLDADLWVTARNAPNVDFGNPFPETHVRRVRSIPGVARADNLIVWYAVVSLPTGAKESVIYYGLEDFGRWGFPWNVIEGKTADLRRGRFVMLDESAERRQVEKLRALKAKRSGAAIEAALANLKRAAEGAENTMPFILDAVRAYATVGEISQAFREVFGSYTETSVL